MYCIVLINIWGGLWGAVVLWAYSSANGAKGREIESPWKQKKKKKKKIFEEAL